ncbi:DUF4350 domain-containing protein [Actinomadura sp. WMMB 499]|uniref:DUF4350 domain-containing protein n=1 Tax=Actinomadura sp. WMMB 499 TaxID=1219491 RepID=UPI0012453CBC|nr:DUF4350 domain-containing protein [Actinomadura sp. WMMB 499]QFG24014.1 DUF4350 domain-containing protein [Actinomadura sp. WMMB 499]
MVTQAPPGAPGAGTGTGAPAEPSARQVAGRRWRASRGILVALLALALIGVILAALRPSSSAGSLDPESPKPEGSRALAAILAQNGTRVDVARDVDASPFAYGPATTLVVTHSERLTDEDVALLHSARANLVLVQPTSHVLRALAPGVDSVGNAFSGVESPGCGLRAARLAGPVSFNESLLYAPDPGAMRGDATACYAAPDADVNGARLVQVQEPRGRTVTVLGSTAPLVNEHLDDEGNAALGMNLAGPGTHTVWLMPDLPEPGTAAGGKSLIELIPFGVKLFFLELLVAVLLVALWRARRLGPVVAEALPVVVRSAETVEGRARLYRASRARDRAADALRAGARERLVPLLGLPRSAAQDPAAAQQIVSAVASRTAHPEAVVGGALYGPEPVDDAGLLALTDVLDDLERQVRQS